MRNFCPLHNLADKKTIIILMRSFIIFWSELFKYTIDVLVQYVRRFPLHDQLIVVVNIYARESSTKFIHDILIPKSTRTKTACKFVIVLNRRFKKINTFYNIKISILTLKVIDIDQNRFAIRLSSNFHSIIYFKLWFMKFYFKWILPSQNALHFALCSDWKLSWNLLYTVFVLSTLTNRFYVNDYF